MYVCIYIYTHLVSHTADDVGTRRSCRAFVRGMDVFIVTLTDIGPDGIYNNNMQIPRRTLSTVAVGIWYHESVVR